jgi:predicted ATPase
MSTSNSPIIGRDLELERLASALASSMRGNGKMVLVSGEAGIGKTRLVEEFTRLATGAGCIVFQGSCPQNIVDPFHPFKISAQRIEELCNIDRDREARASQIGDKVRRTSQFTNNPHSIFGDNIPSDRSMFGMLDLIVSASDISPLILVIEDMQWADSKTIQLFHLLTRNIKDSRIMLMGTYRTGDVLSVQENEDGSLVSAIRMMKKERFVEEIELSPLVPEQMGIAIRLFLGNPSDKSVLEKIVHESDGNPLYAVETIRYLVNGHFIAMNDGVWGWNKELPPNIPQSIQELIMPRVRNLREKDRQVLECASIFEDTIDPNVLNSVLKGALIDTLESLDTLSINTQFIEHKEDSFSFVHDKVRRIIKDQIPKTRNIKLNRMIAEILSKSDASGSLADKISYHYWESGSFSQCASHSIIAGEICIQKEAVREAMIYFERANKSLEKIDLDNDNLHYRMELGKARTLRMEGRIKEAADGFERCLKVARDGKERAVLLWNLADCFGPMFLGKGDSTISNNYLDQADSIIDAEIYDKGEIASTRATLAEQTESLVKAEPYFDIAEEMFLASGDDERLVSQICSRVFAYLVRDDVDKALKTMSRTRRDKAYLKISTEIEIYYRYIFINLLSGNYDEASQYFDQCQELSEKLGDSLTVWSIYLYRSIMNELQGNLSTSEIMAESGRALAERIGSPYNLAASNAILIQALSNTGRYAKMIVAFNEMEEATLSLPPGRNSTTWGLIYSARGEIAALERNEVVLRESFEKSIEIHDHAQFPHLHGALTRMRYGRHLQSIGYTEEAIDKYKESIIQFRFIHSEKLASALEMTISNLSDG